MPNVQVSADLSVSWLVHDSWTQLYVGVRRLAYELLPLPGVRLTAEDAALCQLGLVGANQLMEIALCKILMRHQEATANGATLTAARLEGANYFDMLSIWIPAVTGKNLSLAMEPFASTERLRRRRNETIHKTSAFSTVEMVRSALYSAVVATKKLYAHDQVAFPYDTHLEKYPLFQEKYFSDVPFPPGN